MEKAPFPVEPQVNPTFRLADGEELSLRLVVQRHQASVRAILAFMGIQPADVDDLAQDTFIHIFQNADNYTPGTDLAAWLKAIARYKGRAYLEAKRRERRNKNRALDYFLLITVGEDSPEDAAEDLMERFRSCLSRLPQAAQQLIMRRYEGVPVKILANETARSTDAMKMTLLRVRRQLQCCVESSR